MNLQGPQPQCKRIVNLQFNRHSIFITRYEPHDVYFVYLKLIRLCPYMSYKLHNTTMSVIALMPLKHFFGIYTIIKTTSVLTQVVSGGRDRMILTGWAAGRLPGVRR